MEKAHIKGTDCPIIDGTSKKLTIRGPKLNLGCGIKKIPGFINIDSRENCNPDIVDDIRTLSKYKPGSVGLIYACHVLEHLKPEEINSSLANWYSVLENGGILRLAMPDFATIVNYYLLTKNLTILQNIIHGSSLYESAIHRSSWDFDRLKSILELVGFTNICRYDWKETEHWWIDDYSQSYLPNFDKVNGILMSLNVEAQKI